MSVICCNVAAMSVACVFYVWRSYAADRARRERTLRERVTYLLWVMAGQVQ
jgi:hypothetical protein